MKEISQPEVMVELLQEGSSPASASTPPRGAVPALLAWRSASPERSTPGPLPYQMPKTPSYFWLPYNAICCVPHIAVAARSSFSAGRTTMLAACMRFFCCASCRS